ncbi:VPLPA-CTERM protein sorting domain-containing protein [Albimonas donghaensis]|uniref:VPLPA-CTERM protein sorting domain-containing protein n=1 Tax=Albimonas donghaensis TaxID=356660 RepID=A0A1H2T872_9RHOB|nr:VPLPA-CTERM sorting domain-containing protein [Albimonas donghaensis]SDW40123.1 VPLPA-CTERM protein sorting domain-containing protein [Albimonas donghaensis]
MPRAQVLAAPLLLAPVLLMPAAAPALDVTSYDNGQVQNDGVSSATNTNIMTGRNGSVERRSYFLFDLGGISGTVTGASLSFAAGSAAAPDTGLYWSFDSSEILTAFQVDTAPDTLETAPGSVAIFNDLGSGDVFGSGATSSGYNTDMNAFSFALNGTALADIEAALGGEFALGGALSDLSGQAFESIFASSSGAGLATLSLTVEASDVPLPAAAPLLAAGLGALGLTARRRRRRAGAAAQEGPRTT